MVLQCTTNNILYYMWTVMHSITFNLSDTKLILCLQPTMDLIEAVREATVAVTVLQNERGYPLVYDAFFNCFAFNILNSLDLFTLQNSVDLWGIWNLKSLL